MTFTLLDWSVVAAVLLFTTWIGHRLTGKTRTLRDFFLGGRHLPWYAVAASIAATEISAVTYISLPGRVAASDMSYLQVVLIGSLITRLLVGYWLVPAYYEREIYSPYDYVGQALGEPARRMTTGLFTLGGILGQSARVYMTAVVLEVLLADELAWLAARTGLEPLTIAVLFFTTIAVLWTWMGGIATVVWTDAILFLLFGAGIAVTLLTVHFHYEGGLFAALHAGATAGKTHWISTSTSLQAPYTIYTALFLLSWGQLGAYGCDQLMVQRILCCRDAKEARRAVIASFAAAAVVVLCALVGVALWSDFQAHPNLGKAAELGDRLFPTYITRVIRPGLKGVVIAGVFAAAISSLDSALAALSQTSLALISPSARPEQLVRRSRLLVLAWGAALAGCAIAIRAVESHWDSVLSMALSLAGFTQGALLAGFLLAFLPLRPRRLGFLIGAPISVLVVAAIQTAKLLPWPWFVPIGCTVTLLLALLIDRGGEPIPKPPAD